jgi:tetratricopeptide (TPR) repeat protein
MTRCDRAGAAQPLSGRQGRITGTGFGAALLLGSALVLAGCAAPGPSRKAFSRAMEESAASVEAQAAAAPSQAPTKTGSVDDRFKAAVELMKARQFKEAEAAFLALTQEHPEFSGPHTDLGILYARAGKRREAIASFDKAVKANPDNAIAYNWLGSLYRQQGDFTRAEQAYQRAIAVKPQYAQAHLNLGLLYELSLRRPQDALESYRRYVSNAGGRNLVVSAWIRDLEAGQPSKSATQAQAASADPSLRAALDGATP